MRRGRAAGDRELRYTRAAAADQRRLEAAMLLAEGRPAEALAAARAGLVALDGAEPTAMAACNRDQLAEIAALAERALA